MNLDLDTRLLAMAETYGVRTQRQNEPGCERC